MADSNKPPNVMDFSGAIDMRGYDPVRFQEMAARVHAAAGELLPEPKAGDTIIVKDGQIIRAQAGQPNANGSTVTLQGEFLPYPGRTKFKVQATAEHTHNAQNGTPLMTLNPLDAAGNPVLDPTTHKPIVVYANPTHDQYSFDHNEPNAAPVITTAAPIAPVAVPPIGRATSGAEEVRLRAADQTADAGAAAKDNPPGKLVFKDWDAEELAKKEAQAQEDKREHDRLAAGNRSGMRVAQAQAPTLPNHYVNGQNEIRIYPDMKDGKVVPGSYMVMAPAADGQGGWQAATGVTSAQLAKIRSIADSKDPDAFGRIVAGVRDAANGHGGSADVMMAAVDQPSALEATMAKLRAQQAAQGTQIREGHANGPGAVYATELPPPAGAEQKLAIDQPMPGTQGAPAIPGHREMQAHHDTRHVQTAHAYQHHGRHSSKLAQNAGPKVQWHPTPDQA